MVHNDGTALEILGRLGVLEIAVAFQTAWFPSRVSVTPMTDMVLGGRTCEQDGRNTERSPLIQVTSPHLPPLGGHRFEAIIPRSPFLIAHKIHYTRSILDIRQSQSLLRLPRYESGFVALFRLLRTILLHMVASRLHNLRGWRNFHRQASGEAWKWPNRVLEASKPENDRHGRGR
jgi:hypothetical protein